MTRRGAWTVILLVIVWAAAAGSVQNEVLLPEPAEVGRRMLSQLGDPAFYAAIGISCLRVLKGLALAGASGIALGYAAGLSEKFEAYFHPVEMIMKTIPNVCYIILSLIWLGSERSVILVAFLVLFPIFYSAAKSGIRAIPKEYVDAARIQQGSFGKILFRICIPLSAPFLRAALETAAGMGFKAAVMAEILGRVQSGAGFQIDYCRVNLDSTGVIAWTLWIILLAALLDALFRKAEKRAIRR